MDLQFDLPKNQSSVIKVIGVGGGGSNAVNHMFHQGIKGVDFMVCNTDAQALQASPVPNRVQLGLGVTEGLGAGANPEVGEQAARESLDDILSILEKNTRMVFITAGMGGGTGTGAAPVIAQAARSLGILTVGIVTSPFAFEGSIRLRQAQEGIDKLRAQVDSLIVINNNKLREIYGNLGFKAGFAKADEVLATAARGIAEVITHHFTTNIDLKDVRTVLADSGTAVMGSALASGEDRAARVIRDALDSPLLNDNLIHGARNVLLLIVSGTSEITFDEIGEISEHIQNQSGNDANIILGIGEDEALGESIGVTIIATGFPADRQLQSIRQAEPTRIVIPLDGEAPVVREILAPRIETPEAVSAPAVHHEPQSTLPEERTVFKLEEEALSSPAVLPVELSAPETEHSTLPNTDLFASPEAEVAETVAAVLESQEGEVSFTFTIRDVQIDSAEHGQELDSDFDSDFGSELESVAEHLDSAPAQNEPVFGLNRPATFEAVEEQKFEANEQPLWASGSEGKAAEILAGDPPAEERRVFELEDLLALEEQLGVRSGNSAAVESVSVSDPELEFELKQPADLLRNHRSSLGEVAEESEISDFDRPIAQSLHHKTEERKARLQQYNYRFTKAKTQDLFGSQVPAYQRLGIKLSDEPSSQSPILGQMGVSGEEGRAELRSHNRFLHDNVD